MKLGYLGFGNLARAVDDGITAKKLLPAGDICVCAVSDATFAYARSKGHTTAKTPAELFSVCDTIFIGVKPKVFREMSDAISALDLTGKRIVSPVCGVHLDELKKTFSCPVMRIMPTLAAAGANDIIGYTDPAGIEDFAELLHGIGDAYEMDEDKLDRLTVAASCGLGYAAHILDAYKDQCLKFGFTEEESDSMTRRMFGFAVNDDESFYSLEHRVATKGGATEAGNNAMDAGLRRALSDGFAASAAKALPKDR